MQTYSDEQLMRLIMAKDAGALEQMYDRYAKLVFSFAMKSNKDPHFAKEIVQLVFTRLWTTGKGYDSGKGLFVNWLLTVTRNIVIDQLRKMRRQVSLVPLEPSAWERLLDGRPHAIPDDVLSRKALKEQIESAYRYLSEQQIRLLQLFYWEGYTLSEIADRNEEPIGTVKSRLHQALKILRKHLHQLREEGRE